jgi:hypothetical protein
MLLEKIKGFMPYILGLALVASIIMYPELQGKKMGANDAVSWVAGAKEFTDYAKNGEYIKWTNRIFSGMPLYTMAGSESGNVIGNVYMKVIEIFPHLLFTLFIVFLCCFLSLRLLHVNPNLAFVLSIAFGLNTWILDSLWAAHTTKVLSLCFMFPVLAGFISFMKSGNKLALIYLMLGLCLSILYGHYQIVYYGAIIAMVIGAYLLYESISEKSLPDFFKKITKVAVCVLVAVVTNISALYIVNDYNKDTMRGGKSEIVKQGANSTGKEGGLDINYAFTWSYTTSELLNFMVPDAMGGSSNYRIKTKNSKLGQAVNPNEDTQTLPLYWGIQPFTGAPNYLGAGIIFLFIFSIVYWKNKMKYLFLGIVILSLCMGLGKSFLGFNEILFNYLPMYNKFRTPTMAFSILNLISILTIGMALQSFFESGDSKENLFKPLKKSVMIVLGMMVVGYIMIQNDGYSSSTDAQVFGNNPDALKLAIEDRTSLFKSDVMRSLAIIAAIAAAIYFYIKGTLSRKYVFILLFFVIFFDLYTVYKRYLSYDVFQKVEKTDDLIPDEDYNRVLEQDKTYFRLFNTTSQNPFSDNTDGYRFANLGGYSPAKLYRYQDLIDVHLSKGNMPVLNMLNTKYIIVDNQGQKIPQQNPDACGNAWFVNDVKFAKSANEEIDSIGTFNPKTTAWVDSRYQSESQFKGNTDPNAQIRLTKYHPENMEYQSSSTSGGFAVFSEIWYRGNEDWNIYVDGKKQRLVRTNYLLRGTYIPAGNHKIEMKFTAEKLVTYKKIGYLASFLLCLIAAIILFDSYKKSKLENEAG